MNLTTYQGRKPITVERKREWLPGIGRTEDLVDVSNFSGTIQQYTERRKVIKVGRIVIPLGRWESLRRRKA